MAVIPLLTGAGLKGKLLEAMYNGIPLVATSVALEGCPDIENIYNPCDTPKDFIDGVITLLNNPAECEKRSKAGQELIKNHFAWESGLKTMNEIIIKAISSYPDVTPQNRIEILNMDMDNDLAAANINLESFLNNNLNVYYTGRQKNHF